MKRRRQYPPIAGGEDPLAVLANIREQLKKSTDPADQYPPVAGGEDPLAVLANAREQLKKSMDSAKRARPECEARQAQQATRRSETATAEPPAVPAPANQPPAQTLQAPAGLRREVVARIAGHLFQRDVDLTLALLKLPSASGASPPLSPGEIDELVFGAAGRELERCQARGMP